MSYYYWVIGDSEYEEYGYFAYEPLGQVEIQFFSYGGDFSLYICPLAPVEDDPNSWPINGITAYLENHGITAVTIPSLEGDFTGSVDFGSGDYVASCVDEGTPGVDSLEDSYLKLLQDAGWTIDDSKYESDGYFATDPSEQVMISFFSYNNEFKAFIHALEPKLYSVTTDDQGNTVITIDFTAFMSDQEVLGGLNIEGYLSFSASKGSGNNDPKYFANGEAVRLYWGNTLEFTPESGVTIASIEFNLTQSGNAFTSSTGSITTGTNKYTYTPNSGTGTQSLKVSGTNGNTRVSEIVITIEA